MNLRFYKNRHSYLSFAIKRSSNPTLDLTVSLYVWIMRMPIPFLFARFSSRIHPPSWYNIFGFDLPLLILCKDVFLRQFLIRFKGHALVSYNLTGPIPSLGQQCLKNAWPEELYLDYREPLWSVWWSFLTAFDSCWVDDFSWGRGRVSSWIYKISRRNAR